MGLGRDFRAADAWGTHLSETNPLSLTVATLSRPVTADGDQALHQLDQPASERNKLFLSRAGAAFLDASTISGVDALGGRSQLRGLGPRPRRAARPRGRERERAPAEALPEPHGRRGRDPGRAGARVPVRRRERDGLGAAGDQPPGRLRREGRRRCGRRDPPPRVPVRDGLRRAERARARRRTRRRDARGRRDRPLAVRYRGAARRRPGRRPPRRLRGSRSVSRRQRLRAASVRAARRARRGVGGAARAEHAARPRDARRRGDRGGRNPRLRVDGDVVRGVREEAAAPRAAPGCVRDSGRPAVRRPRSTRTTRRPRSPRTSRRRRPPTSSSPR